MVTTEYKAKIHLHLDLPQLVADLAVVTMMLRPRIGMVAMVDLAEAERLCDRCLFLVAGELRARGTPAELMQAAGARDLAEAFFHYCGARVDAAGEAR